MASSTFVFVSSDSGAGVVLFTCHVLLLSYHPYVIDRVVFTFRLTAYNLYKSTLTNNNKINALHSQVAFGERYKYRVLQHNLPCFVKGLHWNPCDAYFLQRRRNLLTFYHFVLLSSYQSCQNPLEESQTNHPLRQERSHASYLHPSFHYVCPI